MSADLDCRDEHRRQLIRERHLNGVADVDVVGTHLCVHFLTGIPEEFRPKKKGGELTAQEKAAAMAHVVIRGGRRVTDLRVVDIDPEEAASKYEENCLGVQVDRAGDQSTYTLCFVETDNKGRPTDVPLRSLDPRYACVDFTFTVDCPAEVDCKQEEVCPPEVRPTPPISYLARDYATFRQLILDRLALTMPQWRERHVPDIGIALVEVLAYVGDHLSYFQDAVATEQYLDTARQRISVRRHARLVDYAMHDGCNARVFVDLQVRGDDDSLEPREVFFITGGPGGAVALRESDLRTVPEGWLAFEPLTSRKTLKLRLAHNAIRIYTWGDEECCLPKGATRATLLDERDERDEDAPYDPTICDEKPWPPTDHYHHDKCECGQEPPPPPPSPRVLDLEAGDFLLFEELACAGTVLESKTVGDGGFDGVTARPDADRTHRHVVRLTKVTKGCDALLGNRVLEVEWGLEDALPFPLCVSAISAPPQCDLVRNLAVARGNVVLADHGQTVFDEPLPVVPPEGQPDVCEGEDAPADVARLPARYRPHLREAPLTFAQPLEPGASAAAVLRQNPRAALPAIVLAAIPPAPDGVHPLFAPEDLATLPLLAASLFEPERGSTLDALHRRLPAAVKQLLAERKVNEALVSLDASLRALAEAWSPRPDLLDSGADDPDFVAEVDDAGLAHLRFGDGQGGRAVDVGMAFTATYRSGNGRAGLVGPETIVHVVFRGGFSDVIAGVRNPLASSGAVEPEPLAEVKMYAPGAFRRRLERAVTAEDYATLAQYVRYPERDPRVQSAAAALRWNGSWYDADVAVDQLGTSEFDPALRWSIGARLERYRRMGHGLRVGGARIVPLYLELDLCIRPEYLRAHVLAAVGEALGARVLPDGRRGFFHPDNLTFGAAVYVSRIVAAVMAVEGVAEVTVTRLERLGHRAVVNPEFPQGLLPLGPNEVARLDNDPASPENGLLKFGQVRGGR